MKNWYTELCIKLCSRTNGLGIVGWLMVIAGVLALAAMASGHNNNTTGCPGCSP